MPSMDIIDNIVPYISGEEEKIGPETRKILGHVNKEDMSFIQRSDLKVSATYTRVNVTDVRVTTIYKKAAA